MTTVQIIQLLIAAFLAMLGTIMTTRDMMSALVFKFVPIVSAFVLGLIAFKVIV
jgi:hypothetical protein